jgi:flagellar motor switch/type III secretory pathway protein FliN
MTGTMAEAIQHVPTQALAESGGTAAAKTPDANGADGLVSFYRVPAFLSVEVPVVGLTVRDLFRLNKGSIVSTAQAMGANVPVKVGGRLLAWCEFQVAGDRIACRIAELA